MKRFFFLGLFMLSGCSVLSKPFDLKDPASSKINVTVQLPDGSIQHHQLFNFSPLNELLKLIDCKTCDLSGLNPGTLLKDGDTIVLTELAGLSVSLNQSTIEELMVLPGIGEALAQRIIAYRIEFGYFQKIEDIMRVKGIKQKIFDRFKSYLKL